MCGDITGGKIEFIPLSIFQQQLLLMGRHQNTFLLTAQDNIYDSVFKVDITYTITCGMIFWAT